MPVISNGKLADFQAYYNAARRHASVGGPHALEPAPPGLEGRQSSLRARVRHVVDMFPTAEGCIIIAGSVPDRLRLIVALIRQGSYVRSRRGSVSGNDRQEDFQRERFMENLQA